VNSMLDVRILFQHPASSIDYQPGRSVHENVILSSALSFSSESTVLE